MSWEKLNIFPSLSVSRLILICIVHSLLDINADIPHQIWFLHPGYFKAEGAGFGPGLTPRVVLEVLPQSGGRSEGFLAILTEERFAARVDPGVILQTSQGAKAFVAAVLSAAERSLSRVSPHVNGQIRLASVFGVALCALEPRLRPGVQLAVLLQVLLRAEVLPALQAEERSLPGMFGVVNLQVTFLDKRFRADLALEGSLSCVPHLVFLQNSIAREIFPALRAGVLPLGLAGTVHGVEVEGGVGLLGKSFVTEGTFEGFFSRVGQDVFGQLGGRNTNFLTETAAVLLPVNFPLVARQFLLSGEPEAAALSWTGVRVDLLVSGAVGRQVSLGAEHRLAVTTGIAGRQGELLGRISLRLGDCGVLGACSHRHHHIRGFSIMDGEMFPHVAPDSECLPAD